MMTASLLLLPVLGVSSGPSIAVQFASLSWHVCWAAAIGAYRPFLDPLPLDRYWLVLLAPMVIAIGVVYKTIKLDDLSQLPTQALYLSVQILVFMILAASALWLITAIV